MEEERGEKEEVEGVREKDEERKKEPDVFVRGAPLDGSSGRVCRREVWRREFFSPPRHRPELQVARQRRQHPNVLDRLCKGKRGNFKRQSGQTVLSNAFPSEALFSTALSPSKGRREPSQSNQKTHQLLFLFFLLLYSPSRAPGSTRPRASRPRRRMRVRLWSRRAPVFV